MARVTIEDCLKNMENRFALVHLATQRSRQLVKGSRAVVLSKNKYIVTSLREVASGKVKFAHVLDEKNVISHA